MLNTTDGMVEYFLYCIVYSMRIELGTHLLLFRHILYLVWYLVGIEPGGMILHNTEKYISNTLNDKSDVVKYV